MDASRPFRNMVLVIDMDYPAAKSLWHRKIIHRRHPALRFQQNCEPSHCNEEHC